MAKVPEGMWKRADHQEVMEIDKKNTCRPVSTRPLCSGTTQVVNPKIYRPVSDLEGGRASARICDYDWSVANG
jgi:hypothetical protein